MTRKERVNKHNKNTDTKREGQPRYPTSSGSISWGLFESRFVGLVQLAWDEDHVVLAGLGVDISVG